MTRQEVRVAAVVLGLIALLGVAIHFKKPRLGNPGLAMEKVALTNEVGKIVREERVRLPAAVAGFQSVDAPIMDVEVNVLPPDTSFGRKLYWDGAGFAAQMSAVMMKTDRTSIHRPQTCITGNGWKIQNTEVIDIPIDLPMPYVLKATCISSTKMARDPKKGEISSVYIYWFVSERAFVPGHSEAIWSISRDLIISGVLHPWAYVSCFVQCAPGQEGAEIARVKRLIAGAAPQFQLVPANPKQTASLAGAGSLR